MNGRHALMVILISVVLFTVILAPISSQQDDREYDPSCDANDDGKIDIKDLVYVARLFGTRGTPYPTGKIHFLISPKAWASFIPPVGKEVSTMFVWVAMFKDSTYGSFTMALVGHETYHADHHDYEYHWYTDHLRAGEVYGYLTKKVYPSWEGIPVNWEYDVTLARINIDTLDNQLNATVIVKGTMLFTAKFWADTSVDVASRLEPSQAPHELYRSAEAYRPTLTASVTGLEVGDFLGGRFTYIDAELADSSLLP